MLNESTDRLFHFFFPADLASVDNFGATAWDYARGRQLHYCMLIIASYIRQRAREHGEEIDMGTLANMTLAGMSDIRNTPRKLDIL